MKILSKLVLFLFLVLLFSCKETKVKQFSANKTIELSELGNINAIHVLNKKLYILDASYSTLYQVEKNKPVKILQVPITHRGFILDFSIKDGRAYFVNTYNEVFITNLTGKMKDTIKVSSPDKILLTDDKVYITERIPTSNALKLIAVSDSTEEILSPEIKDYQTEKAGDCNLIYHDKVWLVSASQQSLYSIDSENLFTEYKLDSDVTSKGFKPGRFFIKDNQILFLGSMEQKNYLALCTIKDKTIKPEAMQELPAEVDLSISEITTDKVYIYDYINRQILIYNWPEE